ncbi:hypothetical protein EB796_007585 [Bugula neritina]|uniref:Uncharacterized protein n=1 Tax=Bugula neritina TaxID=10212 RepID=A0A7J7K974_BUGNE|nr:hypothetical protein EB796_007585 [Bugula neritina]
MVNRTTTMVTEPHNGHHSPRSISENGHYTDRSLEDRLALEQQKKLTIKHRDVSSTILKMACPVTQAFNI